MGEQVDSEKKYYRISEIAEAIAVNQNTLRRWLIQYKKFISTKKDGKIKLVHEDSITTLEKIKGYYAESKTESEILDLLNDDAEVIREGEFEASGDKEPLRKKPDELMNEQMDAIHKKLDLVLEQNNELKIEVKGLKQVTNNRDAVLMNLIREMQETKKQIASAIESPATAPKKAWWMFWKT
ncbi:DUF3967 domain-containing protein [Arthrobacter sp. NPDC057013]|uniref:DUF3967 domain-containing protein n=1 Tax=Arthrobacter sp. NPDC057013 TaxID=3345999 RepID=UPI003627D690